MQVLKRDAATAMLFVAVDGYISFVIIPNINRDKDN